MKKLIINEKNLPKIAKMSDSNIRIRINKTQNNHDAVSAPKSIPATIQDIDTCLQTLQKFMNGTVSLDEEHSLLIMQLLKQYKHVLNPNMELMTQSLKFSKLKFRTGVDLEDKENSPLSAKIDKNSKEVSASNRISRLTDKSQTIPQNKCQKNRKLVSMHKKNSERLETITDESEKDSVIVRAQLAKEDNDSLAQSRQSKVDQDKTGQLLAESYDESIVFNQGFGVVQEPRIEYLEEQVTMLTRTVKQKTDEIGQLQERIEQLGANVQNLIKKNSQKSQEYNKLQQQKEELIWKINKLQVKTENSQQVEQIKAKCQQMQEQKESLRKKKQELQKKLKALEREKQEKIEQQLGRYETAQHFYELTRRDLSKENQNLMSLLEERQRQLANLYQVIGFNSNITFNTTGSKLRIAV